MGNSYSPFPKVIFRSIETPCKIKKIQHQELINHHNLSRSWRSLLSFTTSSTNSLLSISLPVCQNGSNLRRVRQSVHILKVLLGELKRSRGNVGNVLSNQLLWID